MRLPATDDPLLLSRYAALLSPEEEVRRARFAFEHLRHTFLVTRVLVRSVLSRYAPHVPPEAWTFSANAYGRPAIAAPDPGLPLRFNLSHTDGLVLLGVTLERDLGVDVEHTGRPSQTVELAADVFSPVENAELLALPESARRRRFFELWTLKESYIKARGMGLALPLDGFSYAFRDGHAPSIAFSPAVPDAPEEWQFAQRDLTGAHLAAFAVRRGLSPDLVPAWRELSPDLLG